MQQPNFTADEYRNAALACRAYAVYARERAANPAFLSSKEIFEHSAAYFETPAAKLERAARI